MAPSRWPGLLTFLAICAAHGTLASGPPPEPPVRGRVTDPDGPVAGARVRYQGTCPVVRTDRDGCFVLPAPPRGGARVTAAKEGCFIAGMPAGPTLLTLRLRRLPAEDFEGYRWVGPTPDPGHAANCGNCHPEVYREWAASGHARSVTNRRFRNLYDGSDWRGRPGIGWNLLGEHPAGAGVCNACHAPTAGFDADLRHPAGVDRLGVHCDYCHKVADADTKNVGRTHGRYGLTLRRPARGQIFFGPLDDVDRGEDSYSPLYLDSRYCASCHEGVVFGVPVYTTYSEWLESPARREGKQCQACHMAPTGTLTDLAPGKGGISRDPRTLASHRLPGGSREMLARCLKVTVRVERMDAQVRADVEVTASDVGHRVPTGFVDRNLVLVVEAGPASDRRRPAGRGPALPELAGPHLGGLPGKVFAKQLKDFRGRQPVPFWKADPDVCDTRLRPGLPDRTAFRFSPGVETLRVRLLYRRFWPEVARVKGWPDDEVAVADHMLTVPRAGRACWSGP
jgi:hypothetical protein